MQYNKEISTLRSWTKAVEKFFEIGIQLPLQKFRLLIFWLDQPLLNRSGTLRLEIVIQPSHEQIFMSHSLLWRHIVLLTVGVYSSNHRVFYTIGISMTRRFQKSVGPSVRL